MRIVIALVTLAASIAPVLAQGVTHTYADGWVSTDFPGAPNPGCSIGSDGSVSGSRLVMGASMRKPAPVDLVIRRTAWLLPDATMRVRAVFPDGTTMTLLGHGHGQAINVDLDAGMLAGWIHMLTASPTMQLVFDGNEPPWQVDLSGTTKVVNAMGDCIRNHNITGVPAPFALGNFAQSAPPPPVGAPAPAPGGDASFAQAMAQMGHPRSDVAPPAQYAPAPSSAAPSPAAPPPVAVSQTLDCAGITSAQDRLACYDTAKSGAALPVTVPPSYNPPPVSPIVVQPPPAPVRQASTEDSFIAALHDAATAYSHAANDMQAGGQRAIRARRLCQVVPDGNIVNWTGTVDTLSSNNSGYGVLKITVAPDITLGTTNNAVSDALSGEHTLIPPGSPLFGQASSLSAGMRVRFSGHLLSGSTDCFEETSLMQSGSMKSPDFIVRFTSVMPE